LLGGPPGRLMTARPTATPTGATATATRTKTIRPPPSKKKKNHPSTSTTVGAAIGGCTRTARLDLARSGIGLPRAPRHRTRADIVAAPKITSRKQNRGPSPSAWRRAWFLFQQPGRGRPLLKTRRRCGRGKADI
jgi:hypothetical protein